MYLKLGNLAINPLYLPFIVKRIKKKIIFSKPSHNYKILHKGQNLLFKYFIRLLYPLLNFLAFSTHSLPAFSALLRALCYDSQHSSISSYADSVFRSLSGGSYVAADVFLKAVEHDRSLNQANAHTNSLFFFSLPFLGFGLDSFGALVISTKTVNIPKSLSVAENFL